MFDNVALTNYKAFELYCITHNINKVDFASTVKITNIVRTLTHNSAGYPYIKFAQLYNQKNKCAYCGVELHLMLPPSKSKPFPNTATLDHVIPKSKGFNLGGPNLSNGLICCVSCNLEKRSRNVFEFLHTKYNMDCCNAKIPMLKIMKNLLKGFYYGIRYRCSS